MKVNELETIRTLRNEGKMEEFPTKYLITGGKPLQKNTIMQKLFKKNILHLFALQFVFYFSGLPFNGKANDNCIMSLNQNEEASLTRDCITTYGSGTASSCLAYVWNSATYTATGIYTQTFINSESCDSIHTLSLTILGSSTSIQDIVAATNYSWPLNGTTYSGSGNASVTLNGASASGCDSTIILNLSIINLNLQLNQAISCHGFNDGSVLSAASGASGAFLYDIDNANLFANSSGLFNGLSAGLHTVCALHVASNVQVCQTIMINEPLPITAVFTTDSTVSCQGDDGQVSVVISGGTAALQPYQTIWTNQSSVVLSSFPNANGHQAIGNLSSGNYFLNIEDDLGCTVNAITSVSSDPAITLSLSSGQTSCVTNLSSVSALAFGGFGNLSISIGGNPFPAQLSPGNYFVVATDSRGCTESAYLDVYSPYLYSDEWYITTCGPYTWPINNQTYALSGNYTEHFTDYNGCDSSYTLVLTANSPSVNPIQQEFGCESFFWTATWQTYTVSGLYTANLSNMYGCDSVVTLDLTVSPGTYLDIKALLIGPYDAAIGLMHDSLREKNLIPLTEPYSAAPYNRPVLGELSGETVSPAILGIQGNDAIVDWVLIEIRDAINPAILVATKRALIQRDGDIVSATDGYSPVYLSSIVPGNYYISLKHRNHLGVMTDAPVAITACALHTVDFINGPVYTNPGWVNTAQNMSNGVKKLWGGDGNMNKNLKYNGTQSDKLAILNTVGIATSNNAVHGYLPQDVNLDGKVLYNGWNSDKFALLIYLGLSNPNMTVNQHTPN